MIPGILDLNKRIIHALVVCECARVMARIRAENFAQSTHAAVAVEKEVVWTHRYQASSKNDQSKLGIEQKATFAYSILFLL